MTDPAIPCLDEDMSETDHALDHDVATMVGVLRDQYSGQSDIEFKIAAALARTAIRVCHDYDANAYYHFLGRLMLTTGREFDDIHDWMERQLSNSGT